MLTIKEMIIFLYDLKHIDLYDLAGNLISRREKQSIYNSIAGKKDPRRAEWLDDLFEVTNSTVYHNSNHRVVNGGLLNPLSKINSLGGSLRSRGSNAVIQSVSLLGSANNQGLPTRRNNNSNCDYYPPNEVTNSVSMLISDRQGLVLSCNSK